jgi:hypothetical protein
MDAVKTAPGDTRAGWVWFDLKASAKPRTLQFTPESGFADQVGEWKLR